MNVLCSVILITSVLYTHGLSAFYTYGNKFTIHGQIIYSGGRHLLIEPDSRLILQLDDISVTDELVTVISEKICQAVVFPIIFDISYTLNKIKPKHLHVLNAKIVNKYDELLFFNEKRIEVKLLGMGRTTFIDVPVNHVSYHDAKPKMKVQEWPELVGTNGDDAVEIIKQHTGFKEVFVVKEGTHISKDLRYDRVCIYVDKIGKVKHIPRPG